MNTRMIICLVVSFVVLSACTPVASAEPAAPTEAPIATDEPKNSEYYPLSTRTGIADVDMVITAVESGDVQALRDLVRFTTIGCTKAEGIGGPPKCGEGEAEGTLVNVLPLLGPEGSFIYESDLSSFNPMKALGIYAVYSVSKSAYSEEAYPAGKYAVMFATEEDQIFVIYQIRDGIVRMDTVFSPTSRDTIIQRDASELILEPK